MSIDYSSTPHVRLYHDVDPDLRDLPLFVKGYAAMLRTLVHTVHGWLPLHGKAVHAAFKTHAPGDSSHTDIRHLKRTTQAMLERGTWLRADVHDFDPEPFTCADGRTVPLSPWLANPTGQHIVIRDWVPSQHGLTVPETLAWHERRVTLVREHVSCARTPTPSLATA